MATKTTNYNLIKPDLTDDADIRVINGNMDVLDNQLKSISDKAGSATNNAYTNVSVNNNYEWTFTKGNGTNVSYDTIKTAVNANALNSTTSTYKVPTDASGYSKLEYWFGTLPYKGSTTSTTDSGVLKFNHWGATAWNSAFVPNNNSARRPYMMYQNGTAGEYSVFKEFAWLDDVNTKLDKNGGNVTGAIYTSDNIYKNANNGVLVVSGSTDATHGGRINLSGEKQVDAGLVKLTADNGTVSNVFEVTTGGGGSRYNFNGLTTYMNSNDDYFRLGGDNAFIRLDKSNKWLRTNAGGLTINGIDCTFNSETDYVKFGTSSNYLAFNKDGNLYFSPTGNSNKVVPYYTLHPVQSGTDWSSDNYGYYKTNDGMLIQWGVVKLNVSGATYGNYTLPQPYGNTKYTVTMSFRHLTQTSTASWDEPRICVDILDGQTIRFGSDNNAKVQFIAIGKAE